jgi:hypothetical protein
VLINLNYINIKIENSIKTLVKKIVRRDFPIRGEGINNKNLNLLIKGNNTIFMMHTFNHPPSGEHWNMAYDLIYLKFDKMKYNSIIRLNSCLKEEGIMEAEVLRSIFSKINFKIDEIYSSPLCRNLETSNLIFKKEPVVEDFLIYQTLLSSSVIEKNKIKFLELFFKKPKNGHNNIIIGHGGLLPGYLSFPMDIAQSGMLVYNHEQHKPILLLDFIDIVKLSELIQ